MFLFTAGTYIDALETLAPDMHAACAASIENRDEGADFIRPDADAFRACPSDSIDYAVMEKTDKAAMVPLDAGWSDVGSWSALHDVRKSDAAGNTVDGDVLLHDCKGTFVQAESRLVAVVGLDDIVVIETKDSMLVVHKDRSQEVKQIVDALKADDRDETRHYRQVYLPWGMFDTLDNEDGFRARRVIVNPGAAQSLQKHARRAEHLVVVRGKARVTKNDEVFDLGASESTFIDAGDVHRIANPFSEPVHFIEVQCGDYLGEDDIVRIEDEYGREGTNT